MFCSIIQIIINIGVFLFNTIKTNFIDLTGFFLGMVISFSPLTAVAQVLGVVASLLGLGVPSILNPVNLTGINNLYVTTAVGVFTGILASIQSYIIIEIAISHIPTVDI